MALNPEALLAHRFPEILQSYTRRDAILYALGIGLGADPLAETDLPYLLETELAVLPTMAVTLGTPGMWVRDPKFGINVTKLVHSAQAARFHAPLPPQADIIAAARIGALADRGEGKGAQLVVERQIRDAQTGVLYCDLQQTLLLRADGGFGGPPAAKTVPAPKPDRAPDARIDFAISPRAALIYRLSGDWNPLHADPAVAAQAGFERPILHGLCSYGIAGWVCQRACPGLALASLSLRFASVVFPGETLQFAIWRHGNIALFEANSGGRKILDQGIAEFT